MKDHDWVDAHEWLDNIKKLDQLIEAKTEERKKLKALAINISPHSDGMPRGNTGTVSQKLQNAVCDLVDLERELDVLIDKYIDEKEEILRVLEKLPEKQYGVLHRYYIRRMTLEAIAEDVGLCPVQIWRIKKKALQDLANLM